MTVEFLEEAEQELTEAAGSWRETANQSFSHKRVRTKTLLYLCKKTTG